MSASVKRLVALTLIFVLAGCSHVFKPTVTQTQTTDETGRPVAVYKNCDPTRVLAGQPACYSEAVGETYCYRTLGDVECYPQAISPQRPPVTAAQNGTPPAGASKP